MEFLLTNVNFVTGGTMLVGTGPHIVFNYLLMSGIEPVEDAKHGPSYLEPPIHPELPQDTY